MGPKKKKTKAEIAEEKLARELEEKKQRELEEKRLLIEAEKKKVEDIRIQELRKNLREAELDRLNSEQISAREHDELLLTKFKYEMRIKNEKIEWQRYLNPSTEPDPSCEKDLNTFISVISEHPVQNFADAMKLCQRIEKVAAPVRCQWGEDCAGRSLDKQALSVSFLDKLSRIVIEKLDVATVDVLCLLDTHLNDKSELIVEEHTKDIYIGLWASFSSVLLSRKDLKFPKIGFEIIVPKQILQNETRFVHRVIRYPFDTQSLLAHHTDSFKQSFTGNTSKYVIGDLHVVELLIPPPMASKIRAKKWTIRDKSAASLKLRKSLYPSTAYMKCTIRVPDALVMADDVRVMLWSPESSDWTETGIAEYVWSEGERKVEFNLTALGTIALVRDRIAEFPYKRWSLKSIAEAEPGDSYEQHARLSLWTQNNVVIIDIIDDSCCLVEPNNKSTADIIQIMMSPGSLCGLLLSRGINIMPTQHDFIRTLGHADKIKKAILEDTVLLEISRLANAIDFEGDGVWNRDLPSDKIGLLAQESSSFTADDESFDYECVLAEMDCGSESHLLADSVGLLAEPGVKFTLVLGNEYGANGNYSQQPRPCEVPHVQLIAALETRTTKECQSRVERAHASFHNTVFTLLRIIRPLSLCYSFDNGNEELNLSEYNVDDVITTAQEGSGSSEKTEEKINDDNGIGLKEQEQEEEEEEE